MAIKFEKIEVGMTLYDVHRYKMAHVKATRLGSWTVRVIEVDAAGRRAMVSWNGNTPAWWSARSLGKLRAKITPKLQEQLSRTW